jgi:hypothetical protein
VQVCGSRDFKHVLVASRALAELVTVQKNRSNDIAEVTVSFVASDYLTSHFDERERVASAQPE